MVLKIALAQAYTDRRNWWIFKEVETGKDAEVDQYLDNGRTAEETAVGDMILQAVLFELALPPASASKPFEL
jgi:ABC-type transport system involved in cytochrome c biogenesis ATPase subunit